MKFSFSSDLSLRCINYNDSVLAISNDRLILENPIKPTKENALWMAAYDDSLWILINWNSGICLIFDMKTKYISILGPNSSTSKDPLTLQVGDHLFLRLSPTNPVIEENKLSLELIAGNDPDGKASPVFFVQEGSDQMFRTIDPNFFHNCPDKVQTIADVADNDYDCIIGGSSFCCLAFIYQTIQNNPQARFLVLEKGLKYLSQHHQHCDISTSPGGVEFRPWTISHTSEHNEFLKNAHGQIPCFGGRSTYWSGWSPTPSDRELVGWPEDLKTVLQQTYFPLAREFLGVIPANEINANENKHRIYDTFQSCLKKCLDSAADMESVDQILHAPLAMGNNQSIKFSTPQMLLSMKNITIIYDCTVEKILHHDKKPTALQTSQGILNLKNSKLILAMSTLPATTLVLNSFNLAEFPQLTNVGKRFTAHPVSSVIARIPRQSLSIADNAHEIELAAIYIAGIKDEAQYHIQLSAVTYRQCQDDKAIYDVCKKYSANSIPRECIDTSGDYIVASSSTLGELDYKNKNNQFNLNYSSKSLTASGELNLCLNDQDKRSWNWMDNVTFEVMTKLSPTSSSDQLEYWDETEKTWKKTRPLPEQIRKKLLVHDASTMWIGDREDTESPATSDYQLRGVDNVYITGGALWPTGGSWNPVLTIVAMAMNLADILYESKRVI